MKKIFALVACLSLVASLAVGGSIAYLQDQKATVNVMTLGKVEIEQIEQERDADGKLASFTQDKPVYPAVYEGTSIPYAEDASKWPVANDKPWEVVEDNDNVVDKFITVKNTGKSEAFVRTLVAFEVGKDAVNDPYMHLVCNGNDETDWSYEWIKEGSDDIVVEIDDGFYKIIAFTLKTALPAGETTDPTVKQVYLDKTATNEVCEAYGESFKILALSQAVQTAGFDTAAKALNTAFGELNSKNIAEWFDGVIKEHAVPEGTHVSSYAALKEAWTKGGTIILDNDVTLEESLNVSTGNEVYLYMNGKTITANDAKVDPVFYPQEGSKLIIDGNGTVDLGKNPFMSLIVPKGEVTIKNGTFLRADDGTPDNGKKWGALFVGTKTGKLTIEGGYFDGGHYNPAGEMNKFTETADDVLKRGQAGDNNVFRIAVKNNIQHLLNQSADNITVYGGTFVGANPAWGDEGCALPTTPDYLRPWSYYQGTFLDGQQRYDDKIQLPAGYTITEGTTADGIPTYTVKYTK